MAQIADVQEYLKEKVSEAEARLKLKEKVAEAQARLKTFEDEAQKFLKEIVEKGKASRKELDEILSRVSSGELLEKMKSSEFTARAGEIQKEVVKGLDELQHRVLDFIGVATRDQVSDLSREIARLSKKVEKIARRTKRPAVNA